MPPKFWTKEKCLEIALKHTTRADFKKYDTCCYTSACQHGWLQEITEHMPYQNLPRTTWTKEICHDYALKYGNRHDFQKYSRTQYTVACKNGWMGEICTHMIEYRKPEDYWTYERCKEAALKHDNTISLCKDPAYWPILDNGWLEELTGHIIRKRVPKKTWTKEKCIELLFYVKIKASSLKNMLVQIHYRIKMVGLMNYFLILNQFNFACF